MIGILRTSTFISLRLIRTHFSADMSTVWQKGNLLTRIPGFCLLNFNRVLLDLHCFGSLSVPRETQVTLRGDQNFVHQRFDNLATSAKPFGTARVVPNTRFAK